MNDPEVTMSNAKNPTNLVAYTKALEAAGNAIKLVSRVPAPLKSIADQLIRSASSVPANLAEGHGRKGRDRHHHWRIAYGSAKEVDCHLRLLTEANAINESRAKEALQGFDRGARHDLAPPQPDLIAGHLTLSLPLSSASMESSLLDAPPTASLGFGLLS
jgi:four helix bundle protein